MSTNKCGCKAWCTLYKLYFYFNIAVHGSRDPTHCPLTIVAVKLRAHCRSCVFSMFQVFKQGRPWRTTKDWPLYKLVVSGWGQTVYQMRPDNPSVMIFRADSAASNHRVSLSFSRLYTHKEWNNAHNSENLKLMYLLNSKHNSTVFTFLLNS